MANLDETNTPSADGTQNGNPGATPGGLEQRVKDLERENAKLRAELGQAQEDARSLWRTLRAVAPEYAVSEAEMREAMRNPVPFRDAVAEAERMLGVRDDG
jgi:hypothetical protein